MGFDNDLGVISSMILEALYGEVKQITYYGFP